MMTMRVSIRDEGIPVQPKSIHRTFAFNYIKAIVLNTCVSMGSLHACIVRYVKTRF